MTVRRGQGRRASGVVSTVVVTVLVAGCAGGSSASELPTIAPASPAAAPAGAEPAGTVSLDGTPLSGVVLDAEARTVAAVSASPDRLVLLDLDEAGPERAAALPGAPTDLAVGPDGFLVTVGEQLVSVAVDGTATSTDLGAPLTSVVAMPDGGTAAGTSDGRVLVLDAAGALRGTAEGLVGVDDLAITSGGVLLALDRRQTALAVIDTGDEVGLGEALRAGEGATRVVADGYSRALVLDTTGGELLAFSPGPLLLRQRYPVPGAPYGLAYDRASDIAWVSLTATNELVGYDVAGGEPREVFRAPTVAQPDSVAVDSETGTVVVASSSGGGLERSVPEVPR